MNKTPNQTIEARRRGRPSNFDQDQFLNQALEMFWSSDYDSVSFDDLVGIAGATRRVLFAQFGGKEGIFKAAIELYVERTIGLIEDATRNANSVDALLTSIRHMTLEGTLRKAPRGCLLLTTSQNLKLPIQFRLRFLETLEVNTSTLCARLQELGEEDKAARSIARAFLLDLQAAFTFARSGVSSEEIGSFLESRDYFS